MPDWNNRLCAECSFRGVDVALSADNEAIMTCKSCTLDFPPIAANEANYALLVETNRNGEEGNNA